MKFIDMHCDTLMVLLFKDKENMNLYESQHTMVDLKRMRQGGQMAQFFAAFLPSPGTYEHFGIDPIDDDAYIETLHDALLKNVNAHSDIISMAYNADDILNNDKEGKMSAVFTIEDGRSVNGSMEKLKHYYDMGVRAIALTWNFHNCFGAPNSTDPKVMAEGLTEFGKDAVRYMQELGILVDVSHLSEGGFWDVADICTKPFIATHSNCRNLSPHQRNLSDEQLKKLAECGGVTGINFAPAFLNEDITRTDSRAELMAVHARHMADIAGTDVIALGSDLDGIRGDLEVGSSDKFGLIEDALKRHGFTNEEIEKIFWKNAIRVMKDTLR
ncbi:MAG: dipeptidase [Clostridia bacterium]|nr:membrane dipeptidase [Erysipelotrichaceae bacterium]MBQ7982359.1 dipeptidase [Clostridia bacterium]